GNQNSSGFNLIKNLIYQQGGEFDDVGECQDNNARFGAVRYLGGYKKTGAGAPTTIANPSGAYTKENSIDIYPTGTFVEGDIFTSMQAIGFAVTDSVTDLHTVMTFRKNETLGTFDTLRFYTAWLTVGNGDTTSLYTMADRALNWYTAKSISQLSDTLCGIACCCVKVGDFDHSGSIGVVDVTKFVARLFQGGLPPVCFDEVDINNDGKFNIVDLTLLVQRLFGGGPYVPCQCG
ncbi:MAG: EF-hand domain-containing protein, partial [Candidatus Zixiibacteriota bacterium]